MEEEEEVGELREREETFAVSRVEERDARRMTHGKETVQEIVSACECTH